MRSSSRCCCRTSGPEETRFTSPRVSKKRSAVSTPWYIWLNQFEGYGQHDASEFLCYFIDGLHEDLNRVLDKPQTQAVESDDRVDAVVAAESWFPTYYIK